MNLAKFSKSERHKFSNPKTVIADTGASLNVSGCAEGFVNKRIASNDHYLMMGNNHAHSPDIGYPVCKGWISRKEPFVERCAC